MPDRRWYLTSWRFLFSLILHFPILLSVTFSTYRMVVTSAGTEVEQDRTERDWRSREKAAGGQYWMQHCTISTQARRRRVCTTTLPHSQLSCHTLISCLHMFRCHWPWRYNVAHKHCMPDKHANCAHIRRKPASSQSHRHLSSGIFERLGGDAPTADLALKLLCVHSCVLGWQ